MAEKGSVINIYTDLQLEDYKGLDMSDVEMKNCRKHLVSLSYCKEGELAWPSDTLIADHDCFFVLWVLCFKSFQQAPIRGYAKFNDFIEASEKYNSIVSTITNKARDNDRLRKMLSDTNKENKSEN